MKNKEKAEESAKSPPPSTSATINENLNIENQKSEDEIIDYSNDPLRTATGAYRQEDWGLYHHARDKELKNIRDFLWHLCRIPIEKNQKRGRPRLSFADKLFISVYRAYLTINSNRNKGLIRDLQTLGYIEDVPSRNVIPSFLLTAEATQALDDMLAISALPLVPLESHFLADSTGFATNVYAEYRKKKYGDSGKKQVWRQAHAICGSNHKIVTALITTDGTVNDSPYLKTLLEKTSKFFNIEKVSADKGYLSDKNFKLIASFGAEGFIKFKDNAKGENPNLKHYNKAFHQFSFHEEEYLKGYHKRSNIEGVFSTIKRKFYENLSGRQTASQDNEIKAKFICHNLSVLNMAMYKMNIEPISVFQVLRNSNDAPNHLNIVDGVH